MSTEDKAKNLADKAGGAIKEAAGKLTGNESMENEGRADKATADLKQGGEKVKDAVRDAGD
jgi:uncharacterized protein YjbJ (UPF0337 family)